MNNHIQDIRELMARGKLADVNKFVKQDLENNVDPKMILQDGLLASMDDVAKKWAEGKAFIPEVLIAARCMNSAMDILEPYLVGETKESRCKVVFGTVKGDLHDIGKNLCILMMKYKSMEVIDIGVDVSADAFVQAIQEHNPDVVCMSSLLTTSMPYFETVIEAIKKAGLRNQVKIAVGGAPVTQEYADKIGADLYTEDAVSLANALEKMFG
ncbi:MAG: corrinoid protein [Holdemanella sp.]|nr:corrinoid protein [Holdemanella sp.]